MSAPFDLKLQRKIRECKALLGALGPKTQPIARYQVTDISGNICPVRLRISDSGL